MTETKGKEWREWTIVESDVSNQHRCYRKPHKRILILEGERLVEVIESSAYIFLEAERDNLRQTLEKCVKALQGKADDWDVLVQAQELLNDKPQAAEKEQGK